MTNHEKYLKLSKEITELENCFKELEQIKEKYKYFEAVCPGYLSDIQKLSKEIATEAGGIAYVVDVLEDFKKQSKTN